ncbi:hypothetical protein DPMN_118116 [Dreissena polymorpha]|uniref:Uncharacterized protein n=1 Tax=Dreissena polymorpha TaxID=45954 RepID=A0A9D4GJK1_DREPO|nr:hypothetical protein DPMN_118116 [Dreissena polymorpha]
MVGSTIGLVFISHPRSGLHFSSKRARRLVLPSDLSSPLITASAFTFLHGGPDGWFFRRSRLVFTSHPRFRLRFPPWRA